MDAIEALTREKTVVTRARRAQDRPVCRPDPGAGRHLPPLYYRAETAGGWKI